MAKNPTEMEVELNLIKNLTENKGYTEVKLKDYDAMVQNFRVQFASFNSKKLAEKKGEAVFSDSEFDRLISKLDGLTVHECARLSSDQIALELDNEETVYLDFLSLDTDRNIYQVTHQVRMKKNTELEVKRNNRYDVTILINGLPFVQIELKKPAVEINEAVNQINRYRQTSFRGLFHFIRIFVVSNMVSTKYFANMNELSVSGNRQNILKSLVFWWSDENNKRIHQLSEFADSFALPADPYHIPIHGLYHDPDIRQKIYAFAGSELPVSLFVMAGHSYELDILNHWTYLEELLQFLRSFDFEFMTTIDYVNQFH